MGLTWQRQKRNFGNFVSRGPRLHKDSQLASEDLFNAADFLHLSSMLIFGSGTNASAIANRSLQLANAAVYSSIEKLSSGSRITAASDDAGGLAVQVKMVAAFNRLGALKNNLLNAFSYKQVQEDSLKQIGDLLARMSELKTFSLDPTKTASDLSDYATEYSALASQIRKINDQSFNGVRLFSDTSSDQVLQITGSEDGTRLLQSSVPSMKIATITDVACDKTYQIVSGTMEWSEAEADAVSKGGHLAQFKTATDWEQAVFQLGSTLTASPLWIGLKQERGAAMAGAGWKWVTGEALSATSVSNWAGGQPDNGGTAEVASPASANALAWNQPASQCATFGHLGDELAGNDDGVVSGYVIQYTDATGATKYTAVRNTPLTWDQARLAAYHPAAGVLPSNAAQTIGNYSTTIGSAILTLSGSSNTSGLSVGMSLSDGLVIPTGSVIVSIDGPSQVTMSQASAASASITGGALLASVPQTPHLATLKTAAAYSAAKVQLQAQGVGTNEVLWLGGYQSPSGTETDNAADWHWVANVQAGDALVHSETDATMSWGSNSHGGQPDNISSGAVGENVAYMSGSSGAWFDATQTPSQGSNTVSGYLLQQDTLAAITQGKLDAAMQWVAGARAQCGSELSRLQFEMDGVQTQQLNLDAARSRIADIDVASEAGRLTRSQVLVQASTSALAQANASTNVVLRLLA